MARTKAAQALLNQARLNRLGPDLERIAQIKQQQAQLVAELAELEERVEGPLRALQGSWDHNGDSFTWVQGRRTVYNETEIRKEVGEEIWNQVRSDKMDREKMAAKVTDGPSAAVHPGDLRSEASDRHGTGRLRSPYSRYGGSDRPGLLRTHVRPAVAFLGPMA
jgi:hypothetical protein